jgi:hypothetical protein
MRTVLKLAFVLMGCMGCVGCGSSTKPAEGPKNESNTETTDPNETTATAEKPKPIFKYPEPFLEPDCANPQPEGHLPDAKQVVAEERKKHWEQLEACAEAAPPGENVSGEIRTSFRLDPDGVPRCVEVPTSPPPGMEDVVRCVVSVYRSFRFPKPKGGSVQVTDGIHLHVAHEEE